MNTDEQDLVESVYDSIAAARHSLRVVPKKPMVEDGESYLGTFVLNVDSKTNKALCVEPGKNRRRRGGP